MIKWLARLACLASLMGLVVAVARKDIFAVVFFLIAFAGFVTQEIIERKRDEQ